MSVGYPGWNRDAGKDYFNQQMNANDYYNQGNPYAGQQANLLAQQVQIAQQQMSAQTAYELEKMRMLANRPKQPEKQSMFNTIKNDITTFIIEHRSVIYFIAAALILDHFIFRGAFKARLQSMADRVVTKVEEQIK